MPGRRNRKNKALRQKHAQYVEETVRPAWLEGRVVGDEFRRWPGLTV